MSATNVPGITSPTKQSPTTNTKANRLPAPTLFVGPPSRNASQLSVSRTAIDSNAKSSRTSGTRQKTARSRAYNPDGDGAVDESPQDTKEATAFRRPSEKSVDAKWREMQNTLNEVELTAQSSTHVFGESHAKALDDLRNAQVALAKAWGRGSEDKVAAATNAVDEMNVGRFSAAEGKQSSPERIIRQRAETAASVASTTLSDESQLSEDSARSGKSQLEDETAQDIKLASERRAANEAYFKKVDEGVKEVVERLEKVAEAMRGVEGESRSLWSNSDRSSSDTETSKTAPAAAATSER